MPLRELLGLSSQCEVASGSDEERKEQNPEQRVDRSTLIFPNGNILGVSL